MKRDSGRAVRGPHVAVRLAVLERARTRPADRAWRRRSAHELGTVCSNDSQECIVPDGTRRATDEGDGAEVPVENVGYMAGKGPLFR